MKAFVLITIHPGQIREVVRQLQKVEGVREATMTFGPYDAVAVIEAGDINQVGRILAQGLQPIPGITQTLTCLAAD